MHEVPAPLFILPDCVSICFLQGNEDPFPLVYGEPAQTDTILAPISPRKLLIGIRQGAVCNPSKYTAKFNLAAAQCSQDFFISSYNSSDLEGLKKRIGEHSGISLESRFEKKIQDEFHFFDASLF